MLHSAVNASRYGDFLCDSPCERAALRVSQRTESLWEGVFAGSSPPPNYINPAYRPVSGIMYPRVGSPETVMGWGSVFLKHVILDRELEVMSTRRSRLYAEFKLVCRAEDGD